MSKDFPFKFVDYIDTDDEYKEWLRQKRIKELEWERQEERRKAREAEEAERARTWVHYRDDNLRIFCSKETLARILGNKAAAPQRAKSVALEGKNLSHPRYDCPQTQQDVYYPQSYEMPVSYHEWDGGVRGVSKRERG